MTSITNMRKKTHLSSVVQKEEILTRDDRPLHDFQAHDKKKTFLLSYKIKKAFLCFQYVLRFHEVESSLSLRLSLFELLEGDNFRLHLE